MKLRFRSWMHRRTIEKRHCNLRSRPRFVCLEGRITPAPIVTSVTRVGSSPTNAGLVQFQVEFSELVTGVDVTDFVLTNTGLVAPSISTVTGSGKSYAVTVNTGVGDGTLGLNVVDDDSIINALNEPLGGVGTGNGDYKVGEVFEIDRTAPAVTVTSNSLPSVLGSFAVSVTFSENVTGFDPNTWVTNGTVSGLSGNGQNYSFNVAPITLGTVTVFIGAGAALDAATNANTASNLFTRYYFPAGPELPINTATGGQQSSSWLSGRSVAADATGNALVVWYGNGPGDDSGVFAQRFDSTGNKVGGEFRVNTFTTSDQWYPSVAMDRDGDAVVVWMSRDQDGSNFGVYGQFYNATGIPVGGEFRVNTATAFNQYYPSVAMDAVGNALAVWQTQGQDGSGYGIYGQRFNSSGSKVGLEFRVNSFVLADQGLPSLAMDADGDSVVTWMSNGQDGNGYGVYGQRFDNSGNKAGSEFRVNTFTAGSQFLASVSMDATGNFLAAWVSTTQDGGSNGVYGQRFTAAGNLAGSEFRVNTYTTNNQQNPSVAMDHDGDVTIAWQSYGQDGNYHGVFARRFDAVGNPVGGEYQVNVYTTQSQQYPSVAVDADGDAFIVWTSFDQPGGTGEDVYGRRIGAANPDVTPPTITAITINDGSVQRSKVTSVSITFSELVIVVPSAFQLNRTGPGSPFGSVAFSVDTSGSAPSQTIAKLTFNGPLTEFTSLIDGLYTLTVNGSQYHDYSGLAGNTTMLDFHRLFGDADGNGSVTAADFNAFRLSYGATGPSIFDFNGDNLVSASDFNEFRTRYGSTLIP